jgi:hypothetical protein
MPISGNPTWDFGRQKTSLKGEKSELRNFTQGPAIVRNKLAQKRLQRRQSCEHVMYVSVVSLPALTGVCPLGSRAQNDFITHG